MTNASTVVNAVFADLRWLADTGASMEVIGKIDLSTIDKAKLGKVNDPKRCNTGNGTVTIDRQIRTKWGGSHRSRAWVMPCDAKTTDSKIGKILARAPTVCLYGIRGEHILTFPNSVS